MAIFTHNYTKSEKINIRAYLFIFTVFKVEAPTILYSQWFEHQILSVGRSSGTATTYLHSFLMRLAAFLVIFLGNSIMSMPLRMML